MYYFHQPLLHHIVIHNELMANRRSVEESHDRLRWAREQRYKSAPQAAHAMGVPVSTYISHENGTRGFDHKLADYADFFRVNMIWLKTGRGSPRGVAAEEIHGQHPAARLFGELSEEDQVRWLDFGRSLRDSRRR